MVEDVSPTARGNLLNNSLLKTSILSPGDPSVWQDLFVIRTTGPRRKPRPLLTARKDEEPSVTPEKRQYIEMRRFVYPIVRKLSAPMELVDDLMQDGFLAVLENSSPSKSMGWLRTIVHHQVVDSLNNWKGIPTSTFFDQRHGKTSPKTNRAIARWRGMLSLSVVQERRRERTVRCYPGSSYPAFPVVSRFAVPDRLSPAAMWNGQEKDDMYAIRNSCQLQGDDYKWVNEVFHRWRNRVKPWKIMTYQERMKTPEGRAERTRELNRQRHERFARLFGPKDEANTREHQDGEYRDARERFEPPAGSRVAAALDESTGTEETDIVGIDLKARLAALYSDMREKFE